MNAAQPVNRIQKILGRHRRYCLETLLFRAFNPDRYISPITPLSKILTKSTCFDEQTDLTTQERIVESGLIRKLLADNLPNPDYLLLQMFYHQSADVQNALLVYQPLAIVLIKQSRLIRRYCNTDFAILCCLSVAWKKNLFSKKWFGSIFAYHPARSCYRKRRMLQTALEKKRKESMASAESVFMQ